MAQQRQSPLIVVADPLVLAPRLRCYQRRTSVGTKLVRIRTAADLYPPLAIELGRFVQVSAQLEGSVRSAIIRLLPITDAIGSVLFAQNSAKANREILLGLLALPEVSIEDSWRSRLKSFIPKIQQFQEDRNRLVHNLIVAGENDSLAVFRPNKGGTAHVITIQEIKAWSDEAAEIAGWLSTVPHTEYDLSKLVKEWPRFTVKPWPGR